MKTMQQIADELGLARSTVSLCLSENYRNYRISPGTVQRVRDYADMVGFVPNRMAGKLGKDKNLPIGLILNQDGSFEKSASALRYTLKRLHECGRDFVIQGFIGGRLLATVCMLKSMQIKEIIMFGVLDEWVSAQPCELAGSIPQKDRARLAALLKDVNFYSVDYKFPIPPDGVPHIYRMGIDRGRAKIALMEKLLAAGKGNFMCDMLSPGWEKELLSRKLISDERQVIPADEQTLDEFESGRKSAELVLRYFRKFNVRTVLLNDDRKAVAMIEELTKRGVRVPEDLQVIGFDNLMDSPYFRVPLTTMEVPVLENTRQVLDAILEQKKLPWETVEDARMIWRASATL